jgi:hypothetical protein
MSSTVSKLGQPGDVQTAPWHIGTYLTDGLRLLCVIDVGGKELQLEDACTYCLERWPLEKAVVSMREVRPQPEAAQTATEP